MAELPKIVVQRLRRNTNLQSHPDADLINAFVEDVLNQRERNQVLEHLSACQDCREIVALSLPEHVHSNIGLTRSATASWMSWPVLRWAGVAACVVIVGTAVTLHYESRSKSRELVAVERGEVVNLDKKVAPPALPAAQEIAEAKQQHSLSTAHNKLAPAPKRVNPSLSAAPIAPETRDGLSQSGQPASDLQSSGSLEARARAETASPTLDTAMNELAVPGRAKEVEQESAAPTTKAGIGGGLLVSKKAAAAALPVNKAMLSPALRVVPKWTLSSDGSLQRSLDAGKTWETIPVDNQATFRVLAANNFDIWVGGSKGALYHSSDAGEHWTQVQPAVNGELLSADIIGVEFANSHGIVSTSSHETWITEDGGQNWQKK